MTDGGYQISTFRARICKWVQSRESLSSTGAHAVRQPGIVLCAVLVEPLFSFFEVHPFLTGPSKAVTLPPILDCSRWPGRSEATTHLWPASLHQEKPLLDFSARQTNYTSENNAFFLRNAWRNTSSSGGQAELAETEL